MARRSSLVGAAARGALWTGLALIALFLGLVALYAVVDPVSTLMLARTVAGQARRPDCDVAQRQWRRPRFAAIVASEDATFCTE